MRGHHDFLFYIIKYLNFFQFAIFLGSGENCSLMRPFLNESMTFILNERMSPFLNPNMSQLINGNFYLGLKVQKLNLLLLEA